MGAIGDTSAATLASAVWAAHHPDRSPDLI